jgi:hypothetical protein
MKLLVTLLFATGIVLAASCGLNQKDKTALIIAQQAKDDSIRMADINEIKKTEALKAALNDSLTFHTALLNRQQNALVLNKTSLYTANDEMTQIQGFHLGRPPQTREQQIHDQELKIQSLLLDQQKLQAAIRQSTEAVSALTTRLGQLTN